MIARDRGNLESSLKPSSWVIILLSFLCIFILATTLLVYCFSRTISIKTNTTEPFPSELLPRATEDQQKINFYTALFDMRVQTQFSDDAFGLIFEYPKNWGEIQKSGQIIIKKEKTFRVTHLHFSNFPPYPIYLSIIQTQIDSQKAEGPCDDSRNFAIDMHPHLEEMCNFAEERAMLQSVNEGIYTYYKVFHTKGGIKVKTAWGGGNLIIPGAPLPASNEFIFYHDTYRYLFRVEYGSPLTENGPIEVTKQKDGSIQSSISTKVSEWINWLDNPENATERQVFKLIEQMVSSVEPLLPILQEP